MESVVYFTALVLSLTDKISPEEYSKIIGATSREEMAEIAGRLYKWKRISASEREDLIGGIVQDLLSGRSALAEEKASIRKMSSGMGKEDFYDAHRGSPVVQGGLPSLGKRRP